MLNNGTKTNSPGSGQKGNDEMYYVYSRYIKNGKEDFVNIYQTVQDAIAKIASNYNIDKNIGQLGEYYYFMVQR